jgi:hypothetical protein
MLKLKFYDLDKWHSRYVRLRDADNNGNIRCCSCDKKVFWKDSDAGHFVPRQNKSVRYHEKNVFAQCRSCNRFFNGNPAGYSMFLQKRFGFEILENLVYAGHQTKKWTQFEIDNLRDYYKQEAIKLSKEKGLPI